MRRDRVITYHRVRITSAPEGYEHLVGKEGVIQPGPEPYAGYQPIPVKVEYTPGGPVYYMLPEHLEDLSRPLPVVGDTVSIAAKVEVVAGSRMKVYVPGENARFWVAREDHDVIRRLSDNKGDKE